MSRLTSLTDIWDCVYLLLQSDATLAKKIVTWSQDLEAALPDVSDWHKREFPVFVVFYPPDEDARIVTLIGQDSAYREVTYLQFVAITKENIATGGTSVTACKSALAIIEAVVSVIKANKQLVYSGNWAAEQSRIDSVAVAALRYALDEKSWYGVATARLMIINEVGGAE